MDKGRKREYDMAYQKSLAQISIRLPKEKKEAIDQAAKKAGKSTRAYILDAIGNEMSKGE